MLHFTPSRPAASHTPTSLAPHLNTYPVQPAVSCTPLAPHFHTSNLWPPLIPPIMVGSLPPNFNPFYVKMLCGNIGVCQGCRGSLRQSDGSIPSPPFDMVAARVERRQFRDASGTLRTMHDHQLPTTTFPCSVSVLLSHFSFQWLFTFLQMLQAN